MKTHANPSLTLAHAFEQFLEASPFARRTRESYTEDLKPLLTQVGQAPITALTDDVARSFLATQEALAPATYNRRLAALRSFSGFLSDRGWLAEALLEGVERKPEGSSAARALDAQKVESVLRGIENPRDRVLFWLIYDGGLRCQEALAIDIEDISWPDRSILLHGKGGHSREMFFSRTVGTFLDKYLATRASPTVRLTPSGNSIHPTGICTNCAIPRLACEQPTITPKSISSALVAIPPYAAWNATLLITAKQPNAKPASGNVVRGRKGPSCHESTRLQARQRKRNTDGA